MWWVGKFALPCRGPPNGPGSGAVYFGNNALRCFLPAGLGPADKRPKKSPLLPRRGARLKGWKPRCPSTVSFYRKGQRLRRSSSQDIQYCVVLAPCHRRFAAKAPALLQCGFHPGVTHPQDPQRRSRPRQNGEKRLERLFFLPFWRSSTVDSGVPEPPCPEFFGYLVWSFFAYFLCKESRCKESGAVPLTNLLR